MNEAGCTDTGLICDHWIDGDTQVAGYPKKDYLNAARTRKYQGFDWIIYNFQILHSRGNKHKSVICSVKNYR